MSVVHQLDSIARSTVRAARHSFVPRGLLNGALAELARSTADTAFVTVQIGLQLTRSAGVVPLVVLSQISAMHPDGGDATTRS